MSMGKDGIKIDFKIRPTPNLNSQAQFYTRMSSKFGCGPR